VFLTTPMTRPTFADIRAALSRIEPHIHRTPVLTCQTLNRLGARPGGRELYFKCEMFQRMGAFKIRGALNSLSVLLSKDPTIKSVVTHSSGNHAQAIALACQIKGLTAHVVMPRNAPQVKKDAVLGYGATIHECEPVLAAREETCKKVLESHGGVFVHGYNNELVIAGQGTLGIELMEQTNNELDAVIIPVGGGGLSSGVSLSMKALKPEIRVFLAEPRGADDTQRSFAEGRILQHSEGKPSTIADGLLTTLGDKTFPILQSTVEKVICVDDTQISAAMRLVMERMKVVLEPSAAVTVAAVLSNDFPVDPEKVGVVLCGGNVDLDRLVHYLDISGPAAQIPAP